MEYIFAPLVLAATGPKFGLSVCREFMQLVGQSEIGSVGGRV